MRRISINLTSKTFALLCKKDCENLLRFTALEDLLIRKHILEEETIQDAMSALVDERYVRLKRDWQNALVSSWSGEGGPTSDTLDMLIREDLKTRMLLMALERVIVEKGLATPEEIRGVIDVMAGQFGNLKTEWIKTFSATCMLQSEDAAAFEQDVENEVENLNKGGKEYV
jgi:hypothetical protein